MQMFRSFLVAFSLTITAYTLVVGFSEGWGLVSVFVDNILGLDWSGQFTLDFTGYLILSGLWIMWRHRFSPAGIGLGLVAPMVGGMFFMPYLLVSLAVANGDLKTLLVGPARAQR
ncbi:MAG: hypothetical protein ACPG4T_15055 [Nannocystaceae bacterium]